MRKIKNMKKISIKYLVILFIIFCCMFSTQAFASDENQKLQGYFSDEYLNWLNSDQKDEFKGEKTYTVPISQKDKKISLTTIGKTLSNKIFDFSLAGASSNDSKYNLANDIYLKVKNQKNTNECWAFSLTSVLESNITLATGKQSEYFSTRHMNYSTSRNSFTNGVINEQGLNREAKEGGLQLFALAYLTNGQGPVLEKDMPFKDNMDPIDISEIQNKNVPIQVNEYVEFPNIYKEYENGNVKYTDGAGTEYTKLQVDNIRKKVKEHIIKYGAVSAMTATKGLEYFNNQANLSLSTAYYCDKEDMARDHAITIVGWDDSYSKNNFNPLHRPSQDGAYIVLNSYGEEFFDNGYIYISYDDVLIETAMFGITSAEEKDFDNIYQYDFFGCNGTVGASNQVGYGANVFQRDQGKYESLTEIGLNLTNNDSRVEVYVNPNGDDLNINNLVKVVDQTGILNAGYHNFEITPITLTGDKFSVVVKYSSDSGFRIGTESRIENSVYSYISSGANESYISFDGTSWKEVREYDIPGIDSQTANICIKAFTVNEEPPVVDEKISSNVYKIANNEITRMKPVTTRDEFFKNVTINSSNYKLLDKDNNETSSQIMTNGMKLLIDDEFYDIIVTGDINGDGKLTLTDLSKLNLHYLEMKGFILTGVALKAADITYDNKVTITDLSKLLVEYLSL